MDQAQLAEKEKELREKFPAMFEQDGIRPGEVCIGVLIAEAAGAQAAVYCTAGLTSARCGEMFFAPFKGIEGDVAHAAIFADLREYLEVREKYEEREAQKGKIMTK